MFINNSSSEVKLAVLEERLSSYEIIMNKIDEAIQIMGKTSQNISKMLAVHEEKIEQCTKADDMISKLIGDLREENKVQHEKVEERIESIEEKLLDVSRIKWMTIGTGIVLAVLATAFSTLASGWWTPSEMQMLREGHTHQQSVPPDGN